MTRAEMGKIMMEAAEEHFQDIKMDIIMNDILTAMEDAGMKPPFMENVTKSGIVTGDYIWGTPKRKRKPQPPREKKKVYQFKTPMGIYYNTKDAGEANGCSSRTVTNRCANKSNAHWVREKL